HQYLWISEYEHAALRRIYAHGSIDTRFYHCHSQRLIKSSHCYPLAMRILLCAKSWAERIAVLYYSKRSASIGCLRAAFIAGTTPKMTPTTSDISIATTITIGERTGSRLVVTLRTK